MSEESSEAQRFREMFAVELDRINQIDLRVKENEKRRADADTLRAENDALEGEIHALRLNSIVARAEYEIRSAMLDDAKAEAIREIDRLSAERDAALKLAEHYRSTLAEMSKDGCGYAGIRGACAEIHEDRGDWCWCCVARKALEERP